MAKKSDKYNPDGSEGFGTFLYNSNTGQVLGRTCGSWLKITIFYIIFYALLSAFFYLCYQIFATTLETPDNGGAPKWKQDSSLIGSNPGVGFRPMPDQDKNSESTLIWYRSEVEKDYEFWSNQLEDFLEKSKVKEGAENVVACSYGSPGAAENRVCRVPTENLGGCTKETNFGYPEGKPCVLIKLNKIFDWVPEPFGVRNDKYDPETLESDLDEYIKEHEMPADLKTHIQSELKKHVGHEVDLLKTVWLSCQGENVGDVENLPDANMIYKPLQGIPGYFFPFMNQDNYKSPFVMVQLNVPPSARHTLINVECRAWAKNIKYERQNRLGSVHFEILVD